MKNEYIQIKFESKLKKVSKYVTSLQDMTLLVMQHLTPNSKHDFTYTMSYQKVPGLLSFNVK